MCRAQFSLVLCPLPLLAFSRSPSKPGDEVLETQLLCCQGQPSKGHVRCLQIIRFSFKVLILQKCQLFQFVSWFLKHLGHPEHALSFLYSPENQNQLVLVGNSQAGVWEHYTSFSTFEVGQNSTSSSITASLLLTVVS